MNKYRTYLIRRGWVFEESENPPELWASLNIAITYDEARDIIDSHLNMMEASANYDLPLPNHIIKYEITFQGNQPTIEVRKSND